VKAEKLFELGCSLGEGAMWHTSRKSFFWVDIEQKKFYECRWADKQLTTYVLDRRVTLILQTPDENKVLLGVQGGIIRYGLDTNQQRWITELDADKPQNRTNDGAYDSAGRIWIGTMNQDCKEGLGALYRIPVNGEPERVIENMTIPNGIVWSAEGKTMYHVESHENVVRAYDYDSGTGVIHFNRNAIQVPVELGSPDGMCIDDEGMLWIAHWNGYGVYRWDPVNGKLLSKIEVPAPQVTSCVFGGDDGKTLLITTARQGMSAAQLNLYPGSGDVFVAKMSD
jgi:sugar lactone lactonase YvrE